MVDDLNAALKPFHDKAQLGLDLLAQGGKPSPEQLSAGEDGIIRMKGRFDALLNLTSDKLRVQLLAASASQNVAYLYKEYGKELPHLKQAADTAWAAIAGFSGHV